MWSAGEGFDDPHPLRAVLPGCGPVRPVQVVELGVRVRFDGPLFHAGEREQGGGVQGGFAPFDPQGVQDVEVGVERQVGQPYETRFGGCSTASCGSSRGVSCCSVVPREKETTVRVAGPLAGPSGEGEGL